ncbi:MAG: glycosyltransferase [Proteobacteria bacterium]|jgi:hypothetical protein|nr:glycosyltransferase [Pseudomonadota bacterium]
MSRTGRDGAPHIVVAVPCYNEGTTIGKVVRDFRRQLPEAEVFVFDNNSTDNTIDEARAAGATVHGVLRQGKGAVVAAMLSRTNADYYVMVDGDDTYPAENVRDLLRPVIEGQADMTVGYRLSEYTSNSFRPLHVVGNRVITSVTNLVFRSQLKDVLSGYRAFSRQVADALPAISTGFEIESEMTLMALRNGFTIQEVPIPYRERPSGSVSKLSTFKDGFRILLHIAIILVTFKPLTLFGSIGIVLAVAAGVTGAFPILEYVQEPSVSSYGMMVISIAAGFGAAMSFVAGIILYVVSNLFINYGNIITRKQQHIYRMLDTRKTEPPTDSNQEVGGAG